MSRDLKKLVGTSWQRVAVEPKQRGAVPAKASVALQGGGEGGIKGPLYEIADTEHARTWYVVVVVPSTDGLITFEMQSVAKIPMKDGSGTSFMLEFLDPLAS